jgi:DeoR/GlpR family transcriptional regulator of sugar metabolism
MWSHERQSKILEILGRDGKVLTNRLADLFAVSRETVRRDLLDMEATGCLLKVHGGAILARETAPEPGFSERLGAEAEAKDAIGARACDLVRPGMTLMIDTGTTTLAFARALVQRGDVRIITNSIEIAQLAAGSPGCDTLLLGGRPHPDVPGTFGEITIAELDRFLADMAVISPVGLHALRGASDYELHEAELARAMMRRTRTRTILCHSAKIGVESRVSICGPEDIDHLVTNLPASTPFELPRGEIHRCG